MQLQESFSFQIRPQQIPEPQNERKVEERWSRAHATELHNSQYDRNRKEEDVLVTK